jgi:Domain of unknown function (DUF4304)
MSNDAVKRKITDGIFAFLKPEGFKKSGNDFCKTVNDLMYFIQIQYSMGSTKNESSFTVNLGVGSALLWKLDDRVKPSCINCHWQTRIGFYQGIPDDKWWTVGNETQATSAANEVVRLLQNKALSHLGTFRSTADITATFNNVYKNHFRDLVDETYSLTAAERNKYYDALGIDHPK